MNINAFTSCPRCTEAIQPEESVICRSCGWMPSDLEKQQQTILQKRVLLVFSAIGALLVGAFIHIINWDRHSLVIIPLKAKMIVGTMEPQDLKQIAEICGDRYKYDCTETALSELAYKHNDSDAFVKLGLLQRKLKNWSAAAKSYEMALALFEKEGPKEQTHIADVYYGLAKSFENIGDSNLAIDYYDRATKAKPGVIQITVTEDYVLLLKRLGNLKAAQKIVAEARRRSGSKTLFAALAI